MAFDRYARTPLLDMGTMFGTSRSGHIIYRAARQGFIQVTQYTTKAGERLDTIAGRTYGEAGLWWVIAAASGIGWGLQVPEGIVLMVPTNIGQVEALVG